MYFVCFFCARHLPLELAGSAYPPTPTFRVPTAQLGMAVSPVIKVLG